MDRNDSPVNEPTTSIDSQVRDVQVTKGCTTFENCFGSRAPNTNVQSVVINMKDVDIRLDVAPIFFARIIETPDIRDADLRTSANLSEKILGCGDCATPSVTLV